ncbi:MAG: metallophosphoesterase family protein [Desulfurococcaceae archaeon]
MGLQPLPPDLEKIHKDSLEQVKKAQAFRSLLERAITFVSSPPRHGLYNKPGVLEVSGKGNYVFIGDLHGDYYALLSVLANVWSDVKGGHTIVFLGDYVDRGYMQVETLSFVLNLKESLPEQTVLIRGNHEPPRSLIPHPHDYPTQLGHKFGSDGGELYDLSLALFDSFPLGVVEEGLFFAVHGGPPLNVLNKKNWREALEIGRDAFTQSTIEEILWSDPTELNVNYVPSPRGAGVLYSRFVSEKALQLIKGKIIIRAHQAVNGFEFAHNGMVVTVFTSPLVYGLDCAGTLKLEYNEVTSAHEVKTICVRPVRAIGT